MHIQGIEFIQQQVLEPYFQAKMVFNSHGAIFFPVSSEHRDQSGPGIKYQDNYKGNALAAMVSNGKIEVRYHREFSDAEVAEMLAGLLAIDSLSCLRGSTLTYQGRTI